MRHSFFLAGLALVTGGLACSDPPPGESVLDITVSVDVSGAGSGSGNVASLLPPGSEVGEFAIDCDVTEGSATGTCSDSFIDRGGQGEFHLVAIPAAGSVLAEWSGDCNGSGSCKLAFNSSDDMNFQVTARFELWSFGGTMAFDSDRDVDGQDQIYTLALDGDSSPVKVSDGLGDDDEPAWSPDGQRIACDSDRGTENEIYVMNADGTGTPQNLTNSPDSRDDEPAWSPDGSHIAFDSDRDGDEDIYVMRADGSGLINVSNTSSNDGDVWWSPDGTQLAFQSDRDGNLEIYVMNVDGTGTPQNLTNHPAVDGEPSWSPDGTRIAFESDRDGNVEVYVINADGSGSALRLTEDSGEDEEPTWSPDSTMIAFTSNRGGDSEIYVMDASDGGNLARLTDNPADDEDAAWTK